MNECQVLSTDKKFKALFIDVDIFYAKAKSSIFWMIYDPFFSLSVVTIIHKNVDNKFCTTLRIQKLVCDDHKLRQNKYKKIIKKMIKIKLLKLSSWLKSHLFLVVGKLGLVTDNCTVPVNK